MLEKNYNFEQNNFDDEKKPEEGVTIKHDKDGISIHIIIYNTNNLANRGSAGVKKVAETGGQISGDRGQNANQGGQIAEECGQNANQDGQVESQGCGSNADKKSNCEK